MTVNLDINRRNLVAGMSAGGTLMACSGIAEAQDRMAGPVRGLAGAAPDITIKSVTTFDVVVPQPPAAAGPAQPGGGMRGRINVTCVETSNGVKGYSFLGSTADQVAAAQPVLVGKSPFQIEAHLKNGLLSWGAIEEALWDGIGKTAGQSVSRLLGGASLPTVPVYITRVWPGGANQEQVTPKQQAEQAALVKAAGFKAMKIRRLPEQHRNRRRSLRRNPQRRRTGLPGDGGPHRHPAGFVDV